MPGPTEICNVQFFKGVKFFLLSLIYVLYIWVRFFANLYRKDYSGGSNNAVAKKLSIISCHNSSY